MTTFKEVYEALPQLVEEGHLRLGNAIDHLIALREQTEDEADLKKIDDTMAKVVERRKFATFAAGKIQAQLKMLAFHLMDNSIPADAPMLGTEPEDN